MAKDPLSLPSLRFWMCVEKSNAVDMSMLKYILYLIFELF